MSFHRINPEPFLGGLAKPMSGLLNPIGHVAHAQKTLSTTAKKLTIFPAFLTAVAFILIVFAMIEPYYSTAAGDGGSIIGTNNVTGQTGCLGTCPANNKNCIGDDASFNCQVTQAFFILAAIFAGLSVFSWLFDVSLFTGSMFKSIPVVKQLEESLKVIAVKLGGGFGGSGMALICLVIGMFLSLFLPINGTGATLADTQDKGTKLDRAGFICTVFAAVVLVLTCYVGGKGVADIGNLRWRKW